MASYALNVIQGWLLTLIGMHVVNVATQNSNMKPKRSKKTIKDSDKSKDHNSKYKFISYFLLILLLVIITLAVILYNYKIINLITANIYSTIAVSLAFPTIVFAYLLTKKEDLSLIIKNLGLSKDKITSKNIIYGIVLFAIIIFLEIIFSFGESIFHISLPTNVKSTFMGMPVFFLIFTFTIAPIDEEILFRGFLVPRIGIWQSAFLFAILHFEYGSISEILFAFIFGVIAGYIFKKTHSLYTTIIGHCLINLLGIIMLIIIF